MIALDGSVALKDVYPTCKAKNFKGFVKWHDNSGVTVFDCSHYDDAADDYKVNDLRRSVTPIALAA